MKKTIEEQSVSDYAEFLTVQEINPPSHLTEKVFKDAEAIFSLHRFLCLVDLD